MKHNIRVATITTLAAFAAIQSIAFAAPSTKPGKGGANTDGSVDSGKSRMDLELAVGENKTLPAGDVKNYSEGTPGIVEVKLTSDSSQFVIVGLKAGATSLLLIKKDGTEISWSIHVSARPPEAVEAELAQLLDGISGVSIRRVGNRFFIEGAVATEAELARIKHIVSLYANQVDSLVTVGAAATGEKPPNIRIDFYFVQYERDSSYRMGLSWPVSIGGTVVTSQIGYDFVAKAATAQTMIANQPLPGLDIASQNGWAKVLKQATVITTSGSEALLQNGGEQNFPITGSLGGTSIQKISFGTNVSVLPKFEPQSRDLEVKVEADVSDLAPPISSTNLPGRQTAKLNTIVHMRLGQSLILSGIHTQSEQRTVSGLPGLSDIPIIGFLFGSRSMTARDLEGAIFIIPSVVDTSSPSAMELVNHALGQYEKFEGNMKDIASYPRRHHVAGGAAREQDTAK